MWLQSCKPRSTSQFQSCQGSPPIPHSELKSLQVTHGPSKTRKAIHQMPWPAPCLIQPVISAWSGSCHKVGRVPLWRAHCTGHHAPAHSEIPHPRAVHCTLSMTAPEGPSRAQSGCWGTASTEYLAPLAGATPDCSSRVCSRWKLELSSELPQSSCSEMGLLLCGGCRGRRARRAVVLDSAPSRAGGELQACGRAVTSSCSSFRLQQKGPHCTHAEDKWKGPKQFGPRPGPSVGDKGSEQSPVPRGCTSTKSGFTSQEDTV